MTIQALGYGVLQIGAEAVLALRAEIEAAVGPLEAFGPGNFRQRVAEVVKQFHGMAWKRILLDNRAALEAVVGAPLRYQQKPYMRVLRSGVIDDSVGIHRDTHYGATPSEWVLWVPLTEAKDGAELTILPGSHLQPEEAYPWTQEKGVERYSLDHWLGFMWAPKKMAKDVEDSCIAIPCRIGEAILFNTNCVHGIVVNRAPWTRWSFDIRLVDAAVQLKPHGVHGEIYAPL